jgi:hypothetical protein
MHVPNAARRCVIFIGDLSDRGVFRPRATGFLVAVPLDDYPLSVPYLVTAEHVIVMLAEAGRDLYCRINHRDGSAAVERLTIPHWWSHPDAEREPTDVAVAPVHLNWDVVDHDCIPMPATLEENPGPGGRAIGLGDETFAIGLFKNRAGKERNIPIVRLGSIAALPGEPIYSKWGDVSAYLVEMRSIAGLSGSPVFVNYHTNADPIALRAYSESDPRPTMPDPEEIDWFRYRFLGLIHGHFDIQNLAEDTVMDDADVATGGGGINTGIGVVIPGEKVIETLYQPELHEERRQLVARFIKEKAATPDDAI